MGEADMDRAEEAAWCVVPDDDVAVVWVGKDTDCRGEDTKLLVNPRVNEGSSRSAAAAAAAWVPDNLVMVDGCCSCEMNAELQGRSSRAGLGVDPVRPRMAVTIVNLASSAFFLHSFLHSFIRLFMS